MSTGLDPLIRDLVEWVGREPRTTAEVLEAWRTSCPRLTVWEDALERGLLERSWNEQQGQCVSVTPAGRQFLGDTANANRADTTRALRERT